jgi:carbonic anhydrase
MSNGNNVHAAANGRNIWVPDPCLTLAENHENILLRPDLDRYILSLNAITALPQLLVVTCTDFRVGVSNLERLAAGQAFIQKPAGGFVIQNIEDDLSLSAAFSVVCILFR